MKCIRTDHRLLLLLPPDAHVHSGCGPLPPHAQSDHPPLLHTTVITSVVCRVQYQAGMQCIGRLHGAGRARNSHFANFLSADEQCSDSHHHDNEEHAGTDALDHTAQGLYERNIQPINSLLIEDQSLISIFR